MGVNAAAGIAVSYSDVEASLRITSVLITTTLSVIVFVRDSKRRRNEKKNN